MQFSGKSSHKTFKKQQQQNTVFWRPYCSNMTKTEFSAKNRLSQFLNFEVMQLYKKNQIKLIKCSLRKF